jgi:hypothetical protein
MQIQCPKCDKLLSANDELRGTAVSCPVCQHVFSLPPARQADVAPLRGNESWDPFPLSAGQPGALLISENRNPGGSPLEDGVFQLQEHPSAAGESGSPSAEPPRRKRKKRARKERRPAAGTIQYFAGGLRRNLLVVGSLLLIWLVLATASLFSVAAAWILIGAGAIIYLGAWFRLMYAAFQDETFHGRMIFMTHFYWIVYVFINPSECWKPAAAMLLGFCMSASGLALLGHVDKSIMFVL